MKKKLVVVIPNELETNIQNFVASCDFFHTEKLVEFIYHNDINLYGEEQSESDIVAKLLSEQGFLVLLIDECDDLKNIVAFIPDKISPKQLEYIEKRKEQLNKYTIEFLSKQPNNEYKINAQTNIEQPIINVLIEELNNRLIKLGKIKTLTLLKKNN